MKERNRIIRLCCGVVFGILLAVAGVPAAALSDPSPVGQVTLSASAISSNGLNTWSFTLDTTGFRPDEYLVIASAVQQDAQTTAHFVLLDNVSASRQEARAGNATTGSAGSGSTRQSAFGIDQIADHHTGDRFTISGTTNLAAGDEILVEVYSASFVSVPKNRDGSFSGDAGIVRVTGASGTGAGTGGVA
ncbi:MAG: hypothetical protein WC342_06365 [Methanoregula sp.]|jgi:hypothetical protein